MRWQGARVQVRGGRSGLRIGDGDDDLMLRLATGTLGTLMAMGKGKVQFEDCRIPAAD